MSARFRLSRLSTVRPAIVCPPFVMSLCALSPLAIAAKLIVGVSAKAQTEATCILTQYSWMTNSLRQSPCLVAAYLLGACNNGDWDIVALSNQTYYLGPNQNEINGCQCSTVSYSMISACGICQNETAESWSGWRRNCTSIFPRELRFPLNIPAGTAVPAWAYLDVVSQDQVNLPAASANASAPESTGTPTATGTSVPSGQNKSSNVGAIAGGVVGGVVAVGLIIGAVIMCLVHGHRASHRAPSAMYRAYGNGHVPGASISPPQWSPPMAQPYSYPMPRPGRIAPLRRYDPADPSTFPPPKSPDPATIHTSSLPGHGQKPNYNFLPEL